MAMLIASGSQQQSHWPYSVDKAIRVLIIDDHGVVRKGLRILLESRDRITDVGEASKAADALATIIEERPDIIYLDLDAVGDLDLLPGLPRAVLKLL